jgi:hypothetical protein
LSQAVLLVRHAPPIVADAFLQTRMASEDGGVFGSGVAIGAAESILARAWPE